MISYRDRWPWTKPGCITMTRRQSNNQWSGGKADNPFPKNSECLDFFEIKTAPSSLIIIQRAKLWTRSITHLCWCNWRTFEGKTRRECHQGVLFLHDNAPDHRELATQKKLAYLIFHCLDHPPYSPDLAPSDYHLFPELKKKNNWKVVIFLPTRMSLLPREHGWMDNVLNFIFEWPANVRATG